MENERGESRRLELHVTLHPDIDTWELLNAIFKQGKRIMADVNSMRSELVEANNATNELAQDVQELIGKIKVGAMTQEEVDEIQGGLNELKTRLQGVAAQYPVPDGGGTGTGGQEPMPIDPNDPLAEKRMNRPGRV